MGTEQGHWCKGTLLLALLRLSSHDTGTSTWYDDVEECRPSRDNQGIPSIYGKFSGCSGVTFHYWKVKAREGGGVHGYVEIADFDLPFVKGEPDQSF